MALDLCPRLWNIFQTAIQDPGVLSSILSFVSLTQAWEIFWMVVQDLRMLQFIPWPWDLDPGFRNHSGQGSKT
jgi:hypothetical protein